MKIFLKIILLLVFANPAGAQRPDFNRIIENNGLKGNLNVHDPVMIKQSDTYYVFSTGMGIKTSGDRINWSNAGSVFGRDSIKFDWWKEDIKEKIGLWAPDIHYSNGKYYLYYSVSAWMNFNSSIGLVTNTTLDKNDPAYKWVDEGQVISFKNGGEGVNVIDPNIFINTDGKKYLVYGSYKAGLRLVELDYKTGKLKKDPPDITTLTTSLGEGVFIIKGPKYYYIFASRGRCCAGDSSTYQIVMGRAGNVKGPYVNKEGERWLDNKYSLFLAGDSTEPGRGHNGFFQEHDTTFIVYHAYTHTQKGASLLNIKPMYIDDAGWPALDSNKKLFKQDIYKENAAVRNQRQQSPPIVLSPDDKPAFAAPPNGFDEKRAGLPRGVTDTLTYFSNTTGSNRRMLVYTPPGYSAAKKYPVVYLLHGIGGDELEWMRFTSPHIIFDNLLADKKMQPFIAVFPNGRAMKDDKPAGNIFAEEKIKAFADFERDLLDNVIPFIESKYSVYKDRQHRALAGLSMGGGQALNFGLNNPGIFAWVGGFSSAPNTKSPALLVPDPAAATRQLKLLFISCGNQDGLINISQGVHKYLKENNVPHIWHIDNGKHDSPEWKSSLYLFSRLLFK